MNKPEFTFESESLDLDEIERIICEHYNLGIASSLGSLPLMLSEGNTSIKFSAENGRISCKLCISKNTDTGLFIIEVSDADIIEFSHA